MRPVVPNRTPVGCPNAWVVGEKDGTGATKQVIFSVTFENVLAPGRYYASPRVVLVKEPGAGIVDRRDRATAVVITGQSSEGGVVQVPHDFSLERLGSKQLTA